MNALITHLESFFDLVLHVSLQATLLFFLVALVIRAFGKKLQPRWHHLLWALVFVRLLLPLTPESPFSLFNYLPATGLTSSVEETGAETSPDDSLEVPASISAETQSAALPATQSWKTVAASIWLIGVIGFAVHYLLRVFSLRRRLRDRKDAPESSRQLLAEVLSDLGMNPKIRLQETAAISSPAAIGVFHPAILIPSGLANSLSGNELRHILLHELAHIRRRDVAANWILAATQILHWINPFVWIASHWIRDARENACDAWAIGALPDGQNRPYGQTLVKLLEIQPFDSAGMAPQLETFFSHRAGMERRIRRISCNAYGSNAWTWLGVAMISLLAGAGLTDAQNESADPAESEPVAATVGGQPILQSEVQKAAVVLLQFFIQQNGRENISRENIEKKRKELEEKALNDLIHRHLIFQEFERLGGVIKPVYVDKTVDRIIEERFGGDRSVFLKKLEEQGLSLEQFRKTKEDAIIIQAMRAQNSGDGDVSERKKAVEAWLKTLREKTSIEIAEPE